MSTPVFSIILPVYNQADHLQRIVDLHHAELAKLQTSYELLIVVNGSKDNSLAVAQGLAQKYSEVRILASDKRGWGLAVQHGLKEARGEWICYTNSARTTAPDLLLLLLYARAYAGTVVKADRKVRESIVRRMGSLLYNLECRALFDLSYWDINGTPKVFPRQFEKLLQLQRQDDLIDLEFLATCRDAGYPVVEVPIISTQRFSGRSTTNFRSAIRMYWGAYQLKSQRAARGVST